MLARAFNYRKRLAAICFAMCVACPAAFAQQDGTAPRLTLEPEGEQRQRAVRQSATVHWQGVSLGDAVARLRPLFDDTIFLDRRVDPELRVTLDIDAASAEQIAAALARECGLGVSRIGGVIYLGPAGAPDQLRPLIASLSRELASVPAEFRTALAGRRPLVWPRLSEPRQLVTTIAKENGWRVSNPERIPHDLWAAGAFPELTAVEQMTLLLIGFDLSFELRPSDRTIEIVALEPIASPQPRTEPRPPAPKARRAPSATGKRQVYTLRVQEKPVGAVLRELGKRLHWSVQIDEAEIKAAGKSLDQRISFSVENADQEELLDALLTPAGLEYRIDGDTVRVIPARYSK